MKIQLLLILSIGLTSLNFAKQPHHQISAEVESVSISDNKILVVLNGTIQLSMFSGQDKFGFELPITILYHVPLTILRRRYDNTSEIHWKTYSDFFRDSTKRKVRFSCPSPSYVFDRDRITSITADLIFIEKEKSPNEAVDSTASRVILPAEQEARREKP